ncbi:UNVERIFIED_CONTAM: hypothetical protein PYX00_011795 [Menopon gallinae]|uniref:SET domain-containing protein n=1 Tax=Menopon gallinae TaxID=328185 RepID=A0AAW2H8G4_9NEOP
MQEHRGTVFGDMRARAEEEHWRRVRRILAENAEYIARHRSRAAAARPSAGLDRRHRRVVVPDIQRIPRYRFYVHTDLVIPSQDDPILRYVPLIQNNTEYEDVLHFEGTELADRPFCREEQVREMLMESVFGHYSDLELFRLKADIEAKELDRSVLGSRFRLLCDLSTYLRTPLYKLLLAWERMFDKRRAALYFDEKALDFYFCNICYVFDCCIHSPIHLKDKVRKAPPGERCAARRRMASLHRVFCTARRGDAPQEQAAQPHFEAERAFVSRCYGVDPCVLSLFLYFSTQTVTPCTHLAGTKQHFALKRERRPQRHKSIRHDAFYSPCHHAGACFSNSMCQCWTEKVYCEDTCFCECCDNYFAGCACSVCDARCGCAAAARECTTRCTCRRCPNQSLARGECKKTYVGQSSINGFGLFAGEDIRAESLIMEYTGEIITDIEAERRGHFYDKRQISYLFDISVRNSNTHNTIDAMAMGNNSRFANHSIRPNAVARSVQTNGVKRIGIYASEDIRMHTEIVFDYQYKDEHKKKYNIKDPLRMGTPAKTKTVF